MEVFVNVEAEDLEGTSGPQKALSAYFTMVSMGRNGRPQPVKPYTPETEDEKRMYEEVKVRKESRKRDK